MDSLLSDLFQFGSVHVHGSWQFAWAACGAEDRAFLVLLTLTSKQMFHGRHLDMAERMTISLDALACRQQCCQEAFNIGGLRKFAGPACLGRGVCKCWGEFYPF